MPRRLLVAPLLIVLALGATGLTSGVAAAKKPKIPSWQGHYGGNVDAIAPAKSGAFFFGYNPFKPASKAKFGSIVALAVPFTCADGVTTVPARTVTLRSAKMTVTGSSWKLAPYKLGAISTVASGKFVGKYANGTITMTGVTSGDTTCSGSLTFHLGPRRA